MERKMERKVERKVKRKVERKVERKEKQKQKQQEKQQQEKQKSRPLKRAVFVLKHMPCPSVRLLIPIHLFYRVPRGPGVPVCCMKKIWC